VTVSAVVPTLGASPHLEACLRALRADGVDEIIVVAQGVKDESPHLAALHPLADVWLDEPAGGGFTAATNRGLEVASGDYLATVNDDAVVGSGWTAALVAALENTPGAAAAQGVNLKMGSEDPAVVDGWGLDWNRWWQAVQLGHGEEPPPADAPPREVYGVSATAALYRRAALDQVGHFDERLVSWYEDADLAVRLRAAAWTALTVPAARALHAGGTTAAQLPQEYAVLLYSNRWLVVARMLGRRFPLAVPRLKFRDLADLAQGTVSLTVLFRAWLRVLRSFLRFTREPPESG
jgi:hypothetical protein